MEVPGSSVSGLEHCVVVLGGHLFNVDVLEFVSMT